VVELICVNTKPEFGLNHWKGPMQRLLIHSSPEIFVVALMT